jgi:hypothetical protein
VIKEKVTSSTIGETLTLAHTMAYSGYHATQAYVSIEVATNALDQFVIKAKASDQDTAQTLYSSAGDYTSPAGDLIGTSGDLTVLAVGNGFFRMNIEAYHSIEVWVASGNAAGSGVTVISSVQVF